MNDVKMLERLHEVGKDLASLWGGYCESLTVKTEDKVVEFLCVEHGEKFITSLTFDELEDEYDLVVE